MAASFYITTPIYYVNGRPHIGHAYTTIAADTVARWHRLNGTPTRFMTGTDEHGQKVLDKARERGMDPKSHADDMVTHWKAAWEKMEVRFDHFIRTTDGHHVAAVQKVLQRLWDEGLIYKDSFEGWYSKSAERFWTEKDLVDGKCPETGQSVEWISESNYFFKMSAYQQPLIEHIQANPGFIQPESRKNEVLGFLRKELGDLCISRPKSRMEWGIEIPFDTDFVTYVWFDALLNYVTGLGYPEADSLDFWPADYHLIGKDILTTHAVYWSTMLMALGLPLPKCIYAHGWWVSADGAKMSKSLGNVIDVNLLADEFGVDATRFFFLREIAFGNDGGFSYDGFLTRYNADLANDLGNLGHRTLSMAIKWLGDTAPALGEVTDAEIALMHQAAHVYHVARDAYETLQFHRALEAIFDLVRAGNKYVDTQEPWALNRDGHTERLKTVMRTVLEMVAFVATLLEPVMPGKAGEILGKLGLGEGDVAAYLADLRAVPVGGAVAFDRLDGRSLTLGEPPFPRFRELPENIAKLFAAAEPEPPKPKQKQKAPEPKAQPAPSADTIEFADFMKVKLRTGIVVAAEGHPNADKLLVLQVDIGEERPRNIVAGIASKFTPAELVGRTVVVVANLKPAKLRGVMSEGMLLAAGEKEVVDLVTVNADPGETVR